MDDLFLLLSLSSFIVLLVGLIKPGLVIKWGQKRTRRRVVLTYGIAIIAFFVLFGITTESSERQPGTSPQISSSQEEQTVEIQPQTKNQTDIADNSEAVETSSIAQTNETQEQTVSGDMKVHFIDVGQADSILIQAPGRKTMLVDAGNNADSKTVISYLQNQGVKKVDILVGTHPHEDHIGGLDSVINSFEIGSVYMPKASNNTKTFEDVLLSIKVKGLKINQAKSGLSLDLGSGIKADILAPNSASYDDLNNYSAVVKLTFGNTSFLLSGDAENISEQEMLTAGYDLKADVLKVGHHGSDSSTTSSFLKAVAPTYAVITVGQDNSYGHPHQETLDRLSDANVKVYRTDLSGSTVATSDGKTIKFDTEPSPVTKANPPPVKEETKTSSVVTPIISSSGDQTVYVTNSGEKYHSDGCRYLKKSKIATKLSDAKTQGYSPCKVCKPPQ